MTDIFRKTYVALTGTQEEVIERIKDKAADLYAAIDDTDTIKPDGRCQSLAKTNLEQAVMWAVKSVTESKD